MIQGLAIPITGIASTDYFPSFTFLQRFYLSSLNPKKNQTIMTPFFSKQKNKISDINGQNGKKTIINYVFICLSTNFIRSFVESLRVKLVALAFKTCDASGRMLRRTLSRRIPSVSSNVGREDVVSCSHPIDVRDDIASKFNIIIFCKYSVILSLFLCFESVFVLF